MAEYDPNGTIHKVGTHTVRAFADGVMVTATYNVDQRTMHIGTQGTGRHVRSRNRSGIVTYRLADYSPSNAIFQALHEAGVPVPILGLDRSTDGDLYAGTSAIPIGPPPQSKADTTQINEWRFQVINLNIVHAGDSDT